MKDRKIFGGYAVPAAVVVAAAVLFALVSDVYVKEIALLCGLVSLGVIIWRILFRKVGAFDRVISGSIWRQLGFLLGLVVFSWALVTLQALLFPETLNGEYSQKGKAIASSYRFLGFDYYSDNTYWVNLVFLVASFIGTTIVGGLFVSTFSNLIQQRHDKVEKGLVRYRGIKDHTVILGYNQYTLPLVKQLVGRSKNPVLVMTSGSTELLRSKVQGELDAREAKRVFIYSGSIVSEKHLAEINLPVAREVFVLGEMGEEKSDVLNIECARLLKLCRWDGKGPKPEVLTVHILLDKPQTYSTVRGLSFPKYYYRHKGQTVTYLRPFNFNENVARRLWGFPGRKVEPAYDSLDFRPIGPESKDRVHLFIMGFNSLGRALLLEALRLCHYPNFDEKTGRNKTLITLVDPDIEALWSSFIADYRYVNQISDIEIDRVAGRAEDDSARVLLESSAAAGSPDLVTVAFCFYDADSSYASALSLPDSLYYSLEEKPHPCVRPNDRVRILVRRQESAIIGILKDVPKYRNISFFGAMGDGLLPELFDDTRAMLANVFYTVKCYDETSTNAPNSLVRHFMDKYELGKGESLWSYADRKPAEALSLASQLWYILDEQFRFANRYQTDNYDAYDRYDKLVPGEILSRMEHLRWLAERSIVGFHPFPYSGAHGAVPKEWKAVFRECKSEYLLHNTLIPYYELADTEKDKDTDVVQNRTEIRKFIEGHDLSALQAQGRLFEAVVPDE